MNKKLLVLVSVGKLTDIVKDIKRRGFEAVFLIQNDPEEFKEVVNNNMKDIPEECEVYHEQETYEETLELCKRINPLHILYVSERSVELASRLTTDLKLLGNNYSYVSNFLEKSSMHEALKQFGIRYIKGEIAYNTKEAQEIFEKFGKKAVVLKPSRGAASSDLMFCQNEKQLTEHAENYFGSYNFLTNSKNTELLIQECITGEEYAINTITIKGKTKIVGIWKYYLKIVNGHPIFESTHTYTSKDFDYIGISELTQYCYDVHKALKIENGPAHCEFYIDENGPVLIEVNCRIMGGSFDFMLDPTFGSSETNEFADGLLFENNVDMRIEPFLNSNYKSVMQDIYSPEENEIISMPILEILKKLDTFDRFVDQNYVAGTKIPKSSNLINTIGLCYFLGKDSSKVRQDSETLLYIQNHFFYMLYECKNETQYDEYRPKGTSVKQFCDDYKVYGSILYVNDINETFDFVNSCSWDNIPEQFEGYKFGVLNMQNKPNYTRQEIVKRIFEFFEKIKIGGYIFIPNSSAKIFPYGNRAYEILFKLAGFEIIIPHQSYNGLFAKKISM